MWTDWYLIMNIEVYFTTAVFTLQLQHSLYDCHKKDCKIEWTTWMTHFITYFYDNLNHDGQDPLLLKITPFEISSFSDVRLENDTETAREMWAVQCSGLYAVSLVNLRC